MSFDVKLVIWAMAAQVALAVLLAVWMAVLRKRDFDTGLEPQSVALGEKKWSTRAQQVANCFSNQFELPLLFYVAAILFVTVVRADLIVVVLAWAFVISRYVHAWIHTGSNIVMVRGAVYGVGLLAVIAMWVYLLIVITALPA